MTNKPSNKKKLENIGHLLFVFIFIIMLIPGFWDSNVAMKMAILGIGAAVVYEVIYRYFKNDQE